MKTHFFSLTLASALVASAFAQVPPAPAPSQSPDPIETAIVAATSAPNNPPPALATAQAEAQAKTETLAAIAAAKPVTPSPAVTPTAGGSNQVFAAAQPEESAAGVLDRLTPNLSSEKDLDALTRERARIRLIGDYEAQFRNASLGDVVRALADHAQMRYIAPSGEALNSTVSISGTYNLLDLFDVLQEHYSVAMTYDRGIWRFNKAAGETPIMKTYVLRNNNREDVEISSPVINTVGSQGGSSTNGAGTSGSGANGANGSSSNGSFKVSFDALTKDIEDLLSTPIPQGEGGSDKAVASTGGKVKFIVETNEVMVLASKYHQGLVKEYLSHVDKPLDQIEFSAYFIETSRDPTRDLGVDWNNALSVVGTGNSGPSSKLTMPKASLLTAYQFSAALKFTAQDSESSVVQNPSVLGMPNRKTVLDATRQIPVAQSTFNAGGNTNASTSTSLQYLDIGTIVNIYPSVRTSEDGSKIIRLHVSLVVSSLIGETLISGNPAPLTARRRFEFSAEVPEGETLAIGGLVSSSSNRVSNKVPFLGDVPVAGRLFRSDSDKASRSNMVVYITPRILRIKDTSIGRALPRLWPEDQTFNRPVFNKDSASLSTVRLSLNGFARELGSVQTFLDQRRDPKVLANRLSSLRAELDGMNDYIKGLRKEKVVVDASLSREIDSLASMASSMHRSMIMDMHL